LRQAQLQQTGAVFGMADFQRVLQDEHLGGMRNRGHPLADAGALGTLAGRANRAFAGHD
jgi:hypothetical protein